MYVIISGTNRLDSHTEKVAIEYQKILKNRRIDAIIVSLKNIEVLKKNATYLSIENQYLIPAKKFIIIMPEYNGSYPGVLKAMIDISDIRKVWWWKKAVLTGISTGRAGNLRGMDHMTASLQYMNVYVHPNKLPISSIDKVMDDDGVIYNENTLEAIHKQLDQFIKF
ncbi:MAG: NAD(P)H-dependent oxidoreductase [Ginsengibacter sp.]